VTRLPPLRIDAGVVELTEQLIDIPSESHHESALADLVEAALGACAHLQVDRLGDTIVARTHLGRSSRVLIGGHLDTVPAHGNIPHRTEGDLIYGLGAADMKAGLAIGLRLATTVSAPTRDVTYVFYSGEEVAAEFNGLGHVMEHRSELLACDAAILMEPTNGIVEAGCQGTMRAQITIPGERAHSARSWMGVNAIHAARPVLTILEEYQPRRPIVEGLEYREGLNAVAITGGIAGNVIPDECVVTVNFRFAPDRSVAEAEAHLRDIFSGWELVIVDEAPAARPGLDLPMIQEFAAAMGAPAQPKFGWTDVARFAALDVPALNFGPGDPTLAHHRNECVSITQVLDVESRMRNWLTQ
jgi:succinyl-diaminopimelate desuccinylase